VIKRPGARNLQGKRLDSESSAHKGPTLHAGFTLIETTISTVVVLILAAIAIPSVMQGWNSYRLTSAAGSVAGILERTRFEAIHSNKRLSCLATPSGGGWAIGIDENGNGRLDNTEPQVRVIGPSSLLAAGIAPGPATLGYPTATPPPANTVTFDPRGTVYYGANPVVTYVFYIGFPGQKTYGYRAVTITQMGQVKIWSAAAGGSWVGE
jgi:prepilin-type N-terminal cleavage/methylation domain-containing protein